jgi:hypothetical protein
MLAAARIWPPLEERRARLLVFEDSNAPKRATEPTKRGRGDSPLLLIGQLRRASPTL